MNDINKAKQKNLTLSFIIATYNSSKTIKETFDSINMQDYPKKLIEIIIADGGSTDDTLELAKKYGAKVLNIKSKSQGAEYNRALGAHAAKNEILVFIDHDNVLPHKNWLNNMITPFNENKEIVGVETLRYFYNKKDTLLGRYFSLFGVNDVLPFYFGKADRLSYIYKNPKNYGVFKKAKVTDKGNYFEVNFDKNHIPTLGSNGFLIKKSLLMNNAKVDPHYFFHIDVNVDLIRKGFSKYAFVKDAIIHNTQERGIMDYLKRRKLFMEKYHVTKLPRRYSVYEKKDFTNLVLFVFLSTTLIKPTLDSIRGFLKVRDIAWFLNPFLCNMILFVYSYSLLKNFLNNYERKLL